MNKSLRYISVSHKTASTIQREKYHLSDTEKELLTHLIRSTYSDVSGLFILATCNRTELYFEAIHTTKNDLTALLIDFKSIQNKTSEQMVFISSNQTETSIQHLLEVSSGLESLVFGDAEIISQIKKAHQFSMHYKMQGSLLERALQAVFKTHKRISNETNFRDGTTSVAYKSLKVIRQTYDSETVKSKKILFVGAGDIVKQLFKYNSKFNFNNIYISNRSLEKAIILAQANQCHTYPWEHVLSNNFDDFDVIISAASNCPNLINNISASKKPLLIDLAVPCNIDKRLKEIEHVIFHDLDSISVELEETKEHRLAATDEVNGIINEEIESYKEWLEGGLLRALLAEFKIKVHTKVKTQLNTIESSKITLVTNQVMKKIMVQNELTINVDDIDSLICEEISSLHI
ncbi:MAG: glutamyl-tRNA reductase [Flavobacteriales bacterium]|nr:glutamyl-tRNA reductase [Flavobacteriales bacterium]